MPNLPHVYLSHLQESREMPFLWEKVSRQLRPLFWKELGMRINTMVRGLDALGVSRQDRIGILTRKGTNCFFAHLSTLMLGAISTCFSRGCSMDDWIFSLRESGIRVLFIDTLEEAEAMAQECRLRLPQVTHIIIMEALTTAHSAGPVLLTFLDLMEKGMSQPDRSLALLKQIQPTDRAVLMYAPSEIGPRGVMLTHDDLYVKFRQIEQAVQPMVIDKGDVLLIASPFHETPLHFAAAMLPLMYGVQAYYSDAAEPEALSLTSFNPTLIIGESGFFEKLKKDAVAAAREAGKVDSFILRQALKIGRARYERPNKITFGEKAMEKILRPVFIQKFRARTGDRLRAAIATDDKVSYETQLFFHSFGVDLYELDSGI